MWTSEEMHDNSQGLVREDGGFNSDELLVFRCIEEMHQCDEVRMLVWGLSALFILTDVSWSA